MIEISSLRFERDAFCLDIPSLILGPGITLLVGRNGAGKSTLLQLLATALLPQRGKILYGKRDPAQDLPLIRSQIGFLPTGIELYGEMRVKGFLRYMVTLKGGEAGETERLLATFGLKQVENLKVEKLPHGFKQRLAIAQALIGTPRYLFLDEPLNALDTPERKQLIPFLVRYGEEHTLLISSHEFPDWEEGADRILWIDQGKILFDDRLSVWKRGGWPKSPLSAEKSGRRNLTIEEAYLHRINADD